MLIFFCSFNVGTAKKKDCGHTHADVMEFNYDIKPYGTRNQYQTIIIFLLCQTYSKPFLLLFSST